MQMIYIFWTCSNQEEAKEIIHALLDQQLIACASIFPVESIYRWKGKIEEGNEIKVLLKTQEEHFEAICEYIVENGSYEVPEISQVNINEGNPAYLSWVMEET